MSVIKGDPFGEIKSSGNSTVPDSNIVDNFHTYSDRDSGPTAQHHTLGANRNQASPGNHIHDGKSSRKIGEGLNLTVTGSKGGNAALASLLSMLAQVIDFNDQTT